MDNINKLDSGWVKTGIGGRSSAKEKPVEDDHDFDLKWCVPSGLEGNSAYIGALKELRSSEIIIDGRFTYFFTIEKADPAYIDALKELKRSGFKIDGRFVDAFSLEKANPVFIKALVDLQGAGINVDESFVRWLTLENAGDPFFIEGLKELKRLGIKINEMLPYLTREKSNSAYFQALAELQRSGINIDIFVISALTPENGKSAHYIGALKDLKKSGIQVNAGIIGFLSPEKSEPAYIKVLKNLHDLGSNINDYFIIYLTVKKAGDPAYVGALKKLHDLGIEISSRVIYCLTPENAGDPAYFDALKELKNSGFKLADHFYGLLDFKKTNSAYIGTLTDLQRSGIELDDNFISDLTPEKAADPAYIKTLKDLRGAGVAVNCEIIYIVSRTPEIAKPAYIATLEKMNRSGIKIDKSVLYSLTPGKAGDPAYIEKLIELHKADIKIDGSIIKWLDADMLDDPEFNKKFNSLKVRIDTGNRDEFLLYLCQIPEAFCTALNKIDVHDLGLKDGGHYEEGTRKIDINSKFLQSPQRDAQTCLHELAHRWDYYETKQKRYGLERLYKKISWRFDGISWDEPHFHRLGEAEDFASDYGGTSPIEDLAEMFADYVTDGRNMRAKIREQLSAGKINLAVKYLYLEYLTLFKGQEYELYLDDVPLTVDEVARQIAAHNIKAPEVIKTILERARSEEKKLISQ